MKLYLATSTETARHIIDDGFEPMRPSIPDWTEEEVAAFEMLTTDDERAKFIGAIEREDRPTVGVVIFRDTPPGGIELSRTAEITGERTEAGIGLTLDGGPVLASEMGDFVLCVDVPDHLATVHEVKDEEPRGWPFREYWLPVVLVNEHRDSLVVYGWEDDVELYEVRPDLVGK